MPFGLKNTWETYQHLVDHIFKDLIGKTIEVYINNMVVKSEQKESHFLDLQKMFDILRKYRMKLNPEKCSFRLSSGKILGYLMTHKGIEANPEQIRAIREMPSPRTKKDKAVNFGWTDECEKAFDETKQYLSTPPVLVSPKTGQHIGVYLDATESVVSAVLFVMHPHEKPVYFVSKSLTAAETRYNKIEKIALALLQASRRLKHYFQGRQIVVYSEYPLKRILERADDSIRLSIWSNFLWAYEIKYETRTAEKGHTLAALLEDSLVDDIETVARGEEELFKPIELSTDHDGGESAMEVDTPEPLRTVFTDGLSNVGGDGVGCIILTPEGSRIEKETRLGFQASNNKAEYEAEIIGLKAFKQLDAKNVKLRPRLENRHADALAYLSSAVETDTTHFVVVYFQELPSISDNHFVLDLEHASGGEREATSAQRDTENTDNNMDVDSIVIDDSGNPAQSASDWRQPSIWYLTTSELPKDEKLSSKVKKNAWSYSMIEGLLYRKLKYAKEYAQKCVPCQEQAPIPKRPANKLHPVFSPWPFDKWGLDIVGPLPKALGGVKFALSATDYFTKWVEAVALIWNPKRVSIRKSEAFRFWGDQRILQEPEYSPQFLISLLCLEQRAGGSNQSCYYGQPQERLEKVKGKCTEEFPRVLCSNRTTQKISTGFFPFTLAYGTEAVIPTEVHLKTTKTRAVKSGENDNILSLDKELLEHQTTVGMIPSGSQDDL
ncbi:uncharacterized protein LOC113326225 [Papaver somniferum]|uniref:uncharacterized protein LOC113326225 n=1 Tax=Papaver somniferum TaxID=3469 RepID=UPI000E6FC020|nr:uncharacterized protein LOC113326225 [Papaver somniferum]